MSKLVDDGHNHTIELIGADGKWTAYDIIDRGFASKHYGGERR